MSLKISRAVFDTNILIDFSFSRAESRELIRRVPERLISVVSWVEFMAGVPPPALDDARRFLEDNFEIIYPEEEIADLTADLRRSKRLKFPDAMIYATARAAGVTLITRNTKDFDETTPGVHIPYRL